MFIGDFPEDFTTVTCMFTTHSSTGAPVAPSSAFEAADVIIYKNGSGTQKTSTNGVTMTSPFDSITGLHCVVIDTSNDTGEGGFWVAGAQYTLVLSPDETVDSVAVAKVIGTFGIELAEVLRPTTAGRQLDVSAGGEAGIDWANIGSPTTAVNLSATNIDVDQVVASVSGAVASVTGNVGGNVTGSVGSVAAGGITASSIAADAIGASELATDAVAEISAAVWAEAVRTLTAGTNINGSTFTAIPWNSAWDAEVQSEATDALNAYDPPTKAELDAAVAPLATAAALATVDTEIGVIDGIVDTMMARLAELWALEGLDISNPMTVTPTSRVSGTIEQTISGDGTTTTTVTRDP